MKAACLGLVLLVVPLGLAADGVEQHVALRIWASELKQPDATRPAAVAGFPSARIPLAEHTWDEAGLLSLRDYGGLDAGGSLRLEWNLLAIAQDSSASLSPSAQPLGRSPLLERQVWTAKGGQAVLEADQLNLRWQGRSLALVAGRQPVNLGQNFYFSPMDLFQPFQVQDNYRDFRAGVDALRATWSLGHFTQAEALAVAGYQPTLEGNNAHQAALWLDGPQGQGSLLLRAQSGGDVWAISVLGGRYSTNAVGGASLQLEGLGSSWTLEGLYGHGLDAPTGSSLDQVQATLGWTRQWISWMDSRVELSRKVSVQATQGSGFWISQWLLGAASVNLQVTPLWTLTPTLLWYGDAGQGVALLDAGWSSSENGTLHLILSLPLIFSVSAQASDPPTTVQQQPGVIGLDYRWVL